MTKPTICHLGAWGRNWGDRAIQYALQNAVGREEYRWHSLDIQRPGTSHQYTVSERNDLVLIGGGGLLWDKPELQSRSGWQWDVSASDIERIRCPIIVHAIGDTRFPYGDDPTGQNPAFKESLTILAEKALSFSVRDELTQRLLADMDIETTLCPDPALFIGEPRMEVPDGPPILGVCLAWDKAPWRWPGRLQGAATFVEYMDALSEALAEFVKEGWCLRPFCHIPEDAPTVTYCIELSGEKPIEILWPPPLFNAFHGAGSMVEAYAECTAVVSMRKHGIIIPAGLGVPVVGLGDLAEVGSICEQLAVGLVTSADASPEAFTREINSAMRMRELMPAAAPYGDLRVAHDEHVSRIRGALE